MSHFFVCFVALVIQGGAMASSLRTDFFSEKNELTFWLSVALLSTKNRRGELWDLRLTSQLE